MREARPQVLATFGSCWAGQAPAEFEVRLRWRFRFWFWAGLLVLVSVAPYLPALRFGFITGDDRNITDNIALRTFRRGIPAIWGYPAALPRYRPVAYTALLLQYQAFSNKFPGGYHLVSLALHAANAVLLWTLLRRLAVPAALAAAAVCAVHPIHVTTIAWISQQPMLLCGMFCLSSLLVWAPCFGLSRDGNGAERLKAQTPAFGWRWAIGATLYACAMMSHPVATALPLATVLLIWWRRGRIRPVEAMGLLALAAMGLAWAVLTLVVEQHHASASLQFRALRSFWFSILNLLVPAGLAPIHPQLAPAGPALWPLVLLLVSVGGVALGWMLRRRIGRGPLTAVLLLLVGAAAAYGLADDADGWRDVGDHLLYLPGMSVIVGTVALLSALMQMRSAGQPGFAAWTATAAGATVVAGGMAMVLLCLPEFQSSERFWTAALRRQPDSAIVHNQLGLLKLSAGENAAAMGHFLAALGAVPHSADTHLLIARAYDAAGESEKAMMECHQALALAPDDPGAHFSLANALAKLGNNSAAIEEYQRSLQCRPNDVQTLNNLGLLFAGRGEIAAARELYERAMGLNPVFTTPYINFANLLFHEGRSLADQSLIDQAAALLDEVIAIDPANFEAYLNAAAMVGTLGDLERAEGFYRAAVALRPGSSQAHTSLGVCLAGRRKIGEAVFHLERAVALDPDNGHAISGLRAIRTLQAEPPGDGR